MKICKLFLIFVSVQILVADTKTDLLNFLEADETEGIKEQSLQKTDHSENHKTLKEKKVSKKQVPDKERIIVGTYDQAQKAADEGDYETSIGIFRHLAKQNDVKAFFNLGYFYHSGKGVIQDYSKAIEWYQKAVALEDIGSMNNLGLLYKNGQGTKEDHQKALDLFKKAAEKNNQNAQLNLGEMYYHGIGVEKDITTASNWYLKSAKNGNATAQYYLGKIYWLNELAKDYEKAFTWFQKAAEQNQANAQNSLGWMYVYGNSIEPNYEKAIALFKAASEQENFGFSSLGYMYENGYGVTRDIEKALELYKKDPSDWTKKKISGIEEMKECTKTSTTMLYKVLLKCSNRSIMRERLKDSKITVIQEDLNKWTDSYDSSRTLEGTSKLSIGYTNEDFFGFASYTFPGQMNKELVKNVREMVESKYGPPSTSFGNFEVGKVRHTWKLPDGIEIWINRGWPDTTTYLDYVYPKNYELILSKQKEREKRRDEKKFKAQNNAF